MPQNPLRRSGRSKRGIAYAAAGDERPSTVSPRLSTGSPSPQAVPEQNRTLALPAGSELGSGLSRRAKPAAGVYRAGSASRRKFSATEDVPAFEDLTLHGLQH